MKNSTKVWIIIAVILILAGGALAGITASRRSTEVNNMIIRHNVTNTHPLDTAFSDINISADVAEIRFIPANSSEARVELQEPENRTHNVRIKDGTLTIDLPEKEHKNFFDFLSGAVSDFSFSTEKVTMTLYLPGDAYQSLTVHTSTGDVTIPEEYTFRDLKINASTSDIELSCPVERDLAIETSTGHITLTGLYASSVQLKTSTGRVSLHEVASAGELRIHTSTGDVSLDNCDAGSIKIETSTGDVKGSLRSEKVFSARTSTGKVNVPRTTSGGTCEIITITGNIEIEIR